MNTAQNQFDPDHKGSTRPDAGGEGFDGVEAEILVELDGGAVIRGYGQR